MEVEYTCDPEGSIAHVVNKRALYYQNTQAEEANNDRWNNRFLSIYDYGNYGRGRKTNRNKKRNNKKKNQRFKNENDDVNTRRARF